MNLAGYELQIFATVLVILACALVALLVDYLKGSNEKLRESHVDLLVRQEHLGYRASHDTQLLLHGIAEQTETLRKFAERPIQVVGLAAAPVAAPIETLADIPVTEIPAPKREAPREDVVEHEKVKVSLIPDSKVAPKLEEPVVAERVPVPEVAPVTAEIPSNVVPIRGEAEPAPAAPVPDFERFLDELVTEFEENPGTYENPLEEPAKEEPQPAAEVAPEPVAAKAASPDELFTGLVVSIGINEYDQMGSAMLESVDSLLETLRGSDGSLSRPQSDEVVLVYAGLAGPFAQRRLNELSERLWDFQLRNLGTFSVVFSWGAKDANQETLAQAIAAATERMQETQMSRRSNSLERMRKRLATA